MRILYTATYYGVIKMINYHQQMIAYTIDFRIIAAFVLISTIFVKYYEE